MVRTRLTERKARSAKARRTKAGPVAGPQNVVVERDKGPTERYETLALRSVIDDKNAPATARVQAARTLAEMDGRIGRHQVAPSRVALEGLSVLSRDQLVSELERLREVCDLGLTPWSH
jgi:hypothetical protein